MGARIDSGVALVLAVLVLAGAGLALHRAGFSEQGLVIRQDPTAPWIQPAFPFDGRVQQWGREEAPAVDFHTRFDVHDLVLPVRLELRAFGDFTLSVNDTVVVTTPPTPAPVERSWREFSRLEIGRYLRPGRNTLAVEVRNRRGPPLLSLRLTGAGLSVATGPDWRVRTGRRGELPVWIASDVRRHPQAPLGERPLPSLVAHAPLLLWLLGLGAVISGVVQRRAVATGQPRAGGRSLAVALASISLAWVAVFVGSFVDVDLLTGFDAGNHGLYVEHLIREGSLPLATDGWSMYHPPFFYVLAASLASAGQAVADSAGFAIGAKLVPWLAGLGAAFVAAGLARRLFPDDPAVAPWAAVFAGFLPLNLTLAAYLSNEGLHALLAGGALVLGVDLLLAPRPRPIRIALLSGLLGLALLTKFTALLVVGTVGMAVALRIVSAAAGDPRRVAGGLAVLVLPAVVLAGPFYLRNLLVFGTPLVGNWSLPGADQMWWSAPGFHTPAYYFGFGESLVRPFFSGLVSFGDSLYSTVFGDGLLGGRASIGGRHPHWNYPLMAAGYWLAIPVTLLLFGGVAGGLAQAVAGPGRWRRIAFATCVAVCGAFGWAILYTTLALPYFGQARASYGLAALPALAVFFGLGAVRVDRWLGRRGGAVARALFHGLACAIFGVFYLSFFD